MKKMERVAEGRITKLGKAAHPVSERSSRGHQIFCLLSLLIVFVLGGLAHAESDDALFIDKNGRVGIGTTTPGAELEVAGSTKISGSVGINRAPADDQHLAIQPLEDHIPLSVNDPSGTKKWLTVTKRRSMSEISGVLAFLRTEPMTNMQIRVIRA